MGLKSVLILFVLKLIQIIGKKMAKTIHISKEDINNVDHPNLWWDWLDNLNLPEDTEMIVVEYKYHE